MREAPRPAVRGVLPPALSSSSSPFHSYKPRLFVTFNKEAGTGSLVAYKLRTKSRFVSYSLSVLLSF